jgi:hypothetical protein
MLDAKPSYMTVSPDGAVVLVANTGTVAAPGDSITLIDVASDEMQINTDGYDAGGDCRGPGGW